MMTTDIPWELVGLAEFQAPLRSTELQLAPQCTLKFESGDLELEFVIKYEGIGRLNCHRSKMDQ